MDRYDRQNYTYGKSATKNLFNSSVLLLGSRNHLLTEIAKNLLLSGVNKLYFNEESNTRGYLELNELNPMCKMEVVSDYVKVIEDNNPLVIKCGGSKQDAVVVNNLCREHGSKLIWCLSSGVSGFIFVDVLDSHEVKDLDGETIDPLQIENISTEGNIEVIGDLNNVKDNDIIKFSSLVGNNIDFLREKKYRILIKNRNTVSLINLDESTVDKELLEKMDIQNGAIYIEKSGEIFAHDSLESYINRLDAAGGPPILNDSFNEFFDIQVLRLLLSDIEVIEDVWSSDMDDRVRRMTDNNVGRIRRSLGIEIPCISSIIGSSVSNEAIKILTKKFKPISQWFVYSDHNLVPKDKPIMSNQFEENPELSLSYLMGSEFSSFIKNSSLLMVGCGAIGCEMLKNLAQLGFSTAGDGKIIVTDPDHIEVSNLSRQFLFRNEHVKLSKSKVAAEQLKKFNSNINILPLDQKMCPENQELTDKIFLNENIIGVINALDNVDARRYMDEQCFNFVKPLFESGTQGMKGNTQPVIPFLTETYSNSNDPDQEKSFPVCTIKNFPNQIHHTIHYAMDMFDNFRRGPENVNKYLEDKTFFESLPGYDKGLALKDIKSFLEDNYPPTWQKCAIWAGRLFLENFRDQIIQILCNFPEDSLNNDGTMFWSRGKRCPRSLNLDLLDENVIDFIESTTRLLLYIYGLEQSLFERNQLLEVEYDYYEYEVKDIKIAKDDSELKSIKEDSKESDLPDIGSLSLSNKTSKLNQHVFEKDDDTNFHIKFIQSCSNLRAINYGISPISFEETKSIAGKIIPAVVTTTSLVSGLITVEFLKYCYHKSTSTVSKLEDFRSTFVNLATNLLISSDPISAPKIKIGDVEFNSWKKFVENSDLKLREFLEKYSKEFKNEITMILFGTGILYAEFMRSEDDMEKKLSLLLKEKMEVDILDGKPINLIIAGDDDEVEFPGIQLKIC